MLQSECDRNTHRSIKPFKSVKFSSLFGKFKDNLVSVGCECPGGVVSQSCSFYVAIDQ